MTLQKSNLAPFSFFSKAFSEFADFNADIAIRILVRRLLYFGKSPPIISADVWQSVLPISESSANMRGKEKQERFRSQFDQEDTRDHRGKSSPLHGCEFFAETDHREAGEEQDRHAASDGKDQSRLFDFP